MLIPLLHTLNLYKLWQRVLIGMAWEFPYNLSLPLPHSGVPLLSADPV